MLPDQLRWDFTDAEFSGGTVDFNNTKISGGQVDFSHPAGWSVPPEFRWTGTPPPGVTLPKKKDQSQSQADDSKPG